MDMSQPIWLSGCPEKVVLVLKCIFFWPLQLNFKESYAHTFCSRLNLWIIPALSIDISYQSSHQDGSNQRSNKQFINWDTFTFCSRLNLWIIPAPPIYFFLRSNRRDGSNQRSIQPTPSSSLRSSLWPSFSVKSREPGSSALVSVWFWSFNDFN